MLAALVWGGLRSSLLAQTSFTSNSTTTAWNASRWNNATDGPAYSNAFTANNAVNFTSGNYTFAGMGATTNVGNINVATGANVTFATIGSTFATGGLVRTITVASGSTFDFIGNSISTAAGTGFIKEGAGVFGTGSGSFTGGFTLNAGTVIARGTLGLGSGTGHILTLNGGILASDGTRSFDNTRFVGGIVIGGNVTFGQLSTVVPLASSTANLSFANNVSIGTGNRTLTIGNNGVQTFSGIISGGTGGGITVDLAPGATTGSIVFSGANSYTGGTIVNAGILNVTGSLADAGAITVSGGTYTVGANDTVGVITLSSGTINGTATLNGSSYSLTDSGTISANLTGAGNISKSGSGVATLTGTSTTTGKTNVSAGVLSINSVLRLGTAPGVATADYLTMSGGTLRLTNTADLTWGSTRGVTLAGNATFDTTSPGAVSTISGNFAGAGNIFKTGPGTLALSGTGNNHTGNTTVTGGVFSVTTSNALANAPGSFNAAHMTLDGGTFQYDNSAGVVSLNAFRGITLGSNNGTIDITGNTSNLTNTSVITGVGRLTKIGNGTLTLSGNNTYSGSTTVANGRLALSGSGSIPDGSAVNVSGSTGVFDLSAISGSSETIGSLVSVSGSSVVLGNKTLVAGGNNASTAIDGIISGSGGSLTKNGNGTMTLSAANTYSGGTTVTSGILNVTGSLADTGAVTVNGGTYTVGANDTVGAVTLSSGTINGGSTLTSNTSFSLTNNGTISASLAGTAVLTKTGAGTVLLSGASSYSGGTTVTTGILNVTGSLADTGAVTVNGGTYTVGANDTVGAVTLSSGTIDGGSTLTSNTSFSLTNNGTLSASLSGTAGLTKSGPGTATLSGTNSYTGSTIINEGTLSLTGGFAIDDFSAVSLSNTVGALLQVSGMESIGSLSGGGPTGGNVQLLSSATLTVGNATSTTYGGSVSGIGTLVKQGAGVLNLTGTSVHTGGTTVSAGTLLVNNTSGSGLVSGAIVQDTATLGGSGSIDGFVTIQGGGTLSPGNSPDSISLPGGVGFLDNSTLIWELIGQTTDNTGGPFFDTVDLVSTGNLTFGNGVKSTLKLGSGIDWTHPFWTSDQSWKVFENSSSVVGLLDNSLISIDAFGSTGTAPLASFFSWSSNANSVFLNFSAVPEPASLGASVVLFSYWVVRNRRTRRGALAKNFGDDDYS